MSTCTKCGQESNGMPFHTCAGMNHTDDQLKQLLAKMLPETVKYDTFMSPPTLRWKHSVMVRDTELLHLCDSVEQTLSKMETIQYEDALANEHSDGFSRVRYAWQQRVTALAPVKGVVL
tara:strand:- start:139 stop:495 length:357 start_codon:yes stop_codon:yes gene_type:complete